MAGTGIARAERAATARQLFDRIGDFLTAQGLAPDPTNYAFAHTIFASPDSALAKAVATLTDGGVRLTLRDIEELGGEVTIDAGSAARAEGLVAQTQIQVDGFADMVQDLRSETMGFGRDLAASADAIRRAHTTLDTDHSAVAEVVRITAAMAERVQTAEAQLEQATRETAELRSKLDEARDNARRDPLTDLPNRRAFEEAFTAQAVAGDLLWLAVCDVDHFKSVNDRFGHAVGDRVLKAIGSALREACPGQLVARYGGEEFVVLFSGIDGETAHNTLEHARQTVATKRFKLRETDEPLGSVTFSAGLTLVNGDEAARSAFMRADALLYTAKHDGRNRVQAG